MPDLPSESPARRTTLSRRGAIGKALIVWFVSGSGLLAIVAYLVFHGMGC